MNFKRLALAPVLAATFAAGSTLFAQATTPPPAPATTAAPATAAPAHPHPRRDIAQRKENQQDRIAQGVKSGSLAPGQTAHLEHQEAAINHEEKNMKSQDNGKLTQQDRKTLRTQQNQESRRIYRDKHK